MKTALSPRIRRLGLSIGVDLALLGAFLVVFAYFHHVRVADPAPEALPASNALHATETAAPAAKPAAEPNKADAPDAQETSAAGETEQPAAGEPDLLGGKYADRFTTGEIERSETAYRSANISVLVEKVELEGPITYYVADIYLKDIASFRSAVAYEYADYNEGSRKNVMPTLQMAQLTNALVAISGDNYTFRKEGLVAVRDGKEWYNNLPLAQDICVLYNDGTMETYASRTTREAKLAEIYERGAYQIWSFGPTLVANGEIAAQIGGSKANPLSAVGYYEPGHYCFILVDGRQKGYSLGMSLPALAEVFYKLGCECAYNLDGGDTAVMAFDGSLMSRPENNDPREVSDILYICEPAATEP